VRIHRAANQTAFNHPSNHRYTSVPEIVEVVLSSNQTREQQRLTVEGVGGGFFAVTYKNEMSDALPFDASENTVAGAVKAINPCYSISVNRMSTENGYDWEVTFNCDADPIAPRPILRVLNRNLTLSEDNSTGTVKRGVLKMDAARTQQPSEVLHGTFKLGLEGVLTEPMDVNAKTGELRSQLQLLPGIELVTVTRRNKNDGWAFELTFLGNGDVPALQVDQLAVRGKGAKVEALVIVEGSLDTMLAPIPGYLIQVASLVPAVRLVSNGILAACRAEDFWRATNVAFDLAGSAQLHEHNTDSRRNQSDAAKDALPDSIIRYMDSKDGKWTQKNATVPLALLSACAFVYDVSLALVIDSIELSNGGFEVTFGAATILTVLGSKFPVEAGALSITIGSTPCLGKSVMSTKITCDVGAMAVTAGSFAVQVESLVGGSADVNVTRPKLTFPLLLSSVEPTAGAHTCTRGHVHVNVHLHMIKSMHACK
jgi:hypothetical protein